ncbi:unnamed protein product [Phyllotreta striolata]|uniref:Suppressor APC domain-containing protein n=1 Tax=Phyllotreta striolata TaxID=444603 RepID=A0A9N9U189_PHYSR|nr:unnamed protein product [Phyllotreta striolata]
MSSPTSTLDGLPKRFVDAMRTLFDIMDDKRTGFVRLADIEQRWRADNAPKGVIDSLRKVTPPTGRLTFERFCAGLKISLLRNQADKKPELEAAPAAAPDPPPAAAAPAAWTAHQRRALSAAQLGDAALNFPARAAPKPALFGPPKPPRSAAALGGNLDREEIRSALQDWRKRGIGAGRSVGDGDQKGGATNEAGQNKKGGGGRRREPRRHTLQNGVDYSMLRRMKQMEQEKEVLAEGLGAVERAREWYVRQMGIVQEKMRDLGRTGHAEHWSEAQQERLELRRARVLEVNRHLSALTESWERGGLPLHMNLAVNRFHPAHEDLADRLKRQNRLLTEEVSKKSERISLLEREKANLIQVLQIRSKRPNAQEEAVF